jgi:Fe2+ or Zn2+ uptake regulation protein
VRALGQTSDSRSALVERKLRPTKQREAILDLLRCSTEPLTAEDVFFGLRERDTAACLATVYRNLTLLTGQGLAVKAVSPSDGKARFAAPGRGHRPQVICTGCHRRVDLPGCPLDAFERRAMAETGYSRLRHQLEWYGLCPDCTAQASSGGVKEGE